MLNINDSSVVGEVEAAFREYEAALVANDVPTLDRYFWVDERAIRYGIAENLYGHAAIADYRTRQPPITPDRTLERTVITTFGSALATVSTLFRSMSAGGRVGRQMQTWVRMSEGWRIVAAHVSLIDQPDK